MPEPIIEIIPARPAVRRDAATALDVLVRITPPLPEVQFPRPALNLGLVIDRSGSMAGGRKIEHARRAATFAVEQLLPTDRISVTIFDEEVETIVQSTPAADKGTLAQQIRRITPRGSTALHQGWVEGASQVARHLSRGGIDRVILLSDGLANVGLTDPKAIAADVTRLTRQGVGTTTMGVGDDYNEDLLQAMADAGDGNYYYIEDPAQLADIFQTELNGLMATVGTKVSLGPEPQHGVEVADVLNELEKAPTGRLMLPNLMPGVPVEVALRLAVPLASGVTELLRIRLAWDEPEAGDGRRKARKTLILPSVSAAEWEAMPVHVEVRERVTMLEIARIKLKAQAAMSRGDLAGTMSLLDACVAACSSIPQSMATTAEMTGLDKLRDDLKAADTARFSKRSKYQAYHMRRHSSS